MNNEDYCTLFNDAIKRNETLILFCNCKIRYSGRAESFLDWGDRVIMIKSDNALLVHQPTGNAPINYMKPNTTHALRLEDETLQMKSQNLAMKEHMDITIQKVHTFHSHKLEDGATITVQGTEADMSNMLYENPDMVEEGFRPVSREEQTKYGFVDVLGVDKDGTLTVVECKRYKAELSAVTQLRRYVEKMMVTKGISKIRGIIAAPKISDNAKQMLEDWGYEFKQVHPPKYLEDYHKKQSSLEDF